MKCQTTVTKCIRTNTKIKTETDQTLEIDIPNYAEMNMSPGLKLKQLMSIVAESVPIKPNMSKIAAMLNISRNNIADYLLYMEEAAMIAQLRSETSGGRALGDVNIDDKDFEVRKTKDLSKLPTLLMDSS
jgi:predicted AAA+ superfamily ATPase